MPFLDLLMPPNANQWMRGISSALTVMDGYDHVAYWLMIPLFPQQIIDRALGFSYEKQVRFTLCSWPVGVNHRNLCLKVSIKWVCCDMDEMILCFKSEPWTWWCSPTPWPCQANRSTLPLLPSHGSSHSPFFLISLRTSDSSQSPHKDPVVRIQPTSGQHFYCKAGKFLGYVWSLLFNIKSVVPSSPMLLFSFINAYIFMFIL